MLSRNQCPSRSEAKKGRRTMQSLPRAASSPQKEPQPQTVRLRPVTEETVYRMVTVGAILLVLGSLWVF
jgi:hypothetical protein